MTDQELKSMQERIAVFATKNMFALMKSGELQSLQPTQDGQLIFSIKFSREIADSWYKYFPEQKPKAETLLGKPL